MKPAIFIIALLLAVLWFTLRARLNRSGRNSGDGQPAKRETYLGLRNLALQSSPEKLAGSSAANSTLPCAVLMDWGVPSGTATVAAYSDGTASIYLSGGGGFLGGGQSHESIRQAASRTVEIAAELQPLMQSTTTFPLPQDGQITFYVRTAAGVFTATASEDDLRSHRSPFSKLSDSAQAIITEYRLIQEKK